MSSNSAGRRGGWPDPPVPDVDDAGNVVPPWVKYPNIPYGSIGWRMGDGEGHMAKFDVWYVEQPRGVRTDLWRRYPEPPSWSGFYQYREQFVKNR